MANRNIINVLFVRAAREKSWDDLRRLLEKVEDVNVIDSAGNTALMWAAGKSSDGEEIVRRLLDHGANVIATNKHRCTAFSMAMAKGNKNF